MAEPAKLPQKKIVGVWTDELECVAFAESLLSALLYDTDYPFCESKPLFMIRRSAYQFVMRLLPEKTVRNAYYKSYQRLLPACTNQQSLQRPRTLLALRHMKRKSEEYVHLEPGVKDVDEWTGIEYIRPYSKAEKEKLWAKYEPWVEAVCTARPLTAEEDARLVKALDEGNPVDVVLLPQKALRERTKQYVYERGLTVEQAARLVKRFDSYTAEHYRVTSSWRDEMPLPE